jgi:hypothetical protein
MPKVSRGKKLVQISSMHTVLKKRQLRGESMKGAIWMEGNSHEEETGCVLLRKRKGRHGSGCEHK